jgi:hypothetical protein
MHYVLLPASIEYLMVESALRRRDRLLSTHALPKSNGRHARTHRRNRLTTGYTIMFPSPLLSGYRSQRQTSGGCWSEPRPLGYEARQVCRVVRIMKESHPWHKVS